MKRVVLKGLVWAIGTFLSVFGTTLAAVTQTGTMNKESILLALGAAAAATAQGVGQYLDKAVANEYLKQESLEVKK